MRTSSIFLTLLWLCLFTPGLFAENVHAPWEAENTTITAEPSAYNLDPRAFTAFTVTLNSEYDPSSKVQGWVIFIVNGNIWPPVYYDGTLYNSYTFYSPIGASVWCSPQLGRRYVTAMFVGNTYQAPSLTRFYIDPVEDLSWWGPGDPENYPSPLLRSESNHYLLGGE